MKLQTHLIKWVRTKLDTFGFTILLIIWFALLEPITKQAGKMKIFKDMDDNQFWTTIWTFGFTLALAITGTVVYDSVHEDRILHDLVNQGHDPVALSCLFNSARSIEASCILLAQAKAKEITDAIK